jgi:lambda family phage portal protein
MGILNKIFKSKNKQIEKYREMVKASYYTAASDSKSMDFSFAGSETLNDALKADLTTLRRRIKYELRQNAPAKGLCRTYANACISTGATLSIESIDKVWAEEAEAAYSEWKQNCGYLHGESYAELLHLGVKQLFTCGEYFLAYKNDAEATSKVKLRLMQIKPERVASPWVGGINENIFEGVEVDKNGKPSKYHIMTSGVANINFTSETVDNLRHVYYLEEPEQIRGEPWLAAGLPDLHKKRRYDEARVAAAIIAAKFALFIVNKNPNLGMNLEDLLPEGVIDINDGAATILPPNYEIQSFSGSQPVAGATDFRREMMANAGAGVGMAANIANQDSSTSNFASARYDDVGFSLDYGFVRKIIENRDLTPTAHRFIAEASKTILRGNAPENYKLIWRWPHFNRHTDPQKAASADNARVEGGIASKSEIWGEKGMDKERARQTLLDDVKWHRDNGLIHPIDAMINKEPTNENENKNNDDKELIEDE